MSESLGRLVIIQGNEPPFAYPFESVKWSGRKGAAGRKLEVTIPDSGIAGHERSGIDIEKGCRCIFTWEGKELFRGMFYRIASSEKHAISLSAWDNAIYLANNTTTCAYERKRADEIFVDVCTQFGIATGEIAHTGYAIPTLTKEEAMLWDVLLSALSLTFQATGARFAVHSEGGVLHLLRRLDHIRRWALEVPGNIMAYKHEVSLEDVRTGIRLINDKGAVVASRNNPSLESIFGVLRKDEKIDPKLSRAEIDEMANQMLEEACTPKTSFNINAAGITDVISGTGVYVSIPRLGIGHGYWVDEDTHTFAGENHQMSVKLNLTNEIEGGSGDG